MSDYLVPWLELQMKTTLLFRIESILIIIPNAIEYINFI